MENERNGMGSRVKRFFKNKTITIFLILMVLCVLLGIANPSFFIYENLARVARVVAYTAVIAIGELFVILIGEIDLSVGAVCGLGAVTATLLVANYNVPLLPAILLALLAGVGAGLANGGLIVGLKLPSFIATMGTMQIIKSLGLLLTDGKPVLGITPEFLAIGQGTFLYVPIAVWILIAVALVLSVLLNKTATGRRLYALGGSEEAARFSGIHTKKLKRTAYMISGGMAALSGVILAARMGSAQGSTGAGYEMDAIASAVIGGASFAGGEGNISGTIIGAGIMAVIRNALVMLAVSTYLQSMIIGFIIVGAVAIDQFRRVSSVKVEKKMIAAAVSEKSK